jgi:Mg2+/citrate symporter
MPSTFHLLMIFFISTSTKRIVKALTMRIDQIIKTFILMSFAIVFFSHLAMAQYSQDRKYGDLDCTH